MASKTAWRGRHLILDPGHVADLEARSAVHELGKGMTPKAAEDQAYAEYLHDHMRRAAGHHLAGMRAAHAAGDKDAACSHGIMYGVLARQLKFDPHGEPPEDVAATAKDPAMSKVYDFKPHHSDALVLEHLRGLRGKLAKSEDEAPEAPVVGRPIEGGTDMTHLLPQLRRAAGEQLLVLDGPTGVPTAHHVRQETGRRVPLSSWAQDGHEAVALTPGASDDVKRAATLAFQVRRGQAMAGMLDGLRRVAKSIGDVHALARSEDSGKERLKCGACGEFIYQTKAGKIGFHRASGKLCAGSGESAAKDAEKSEDLQVRTTYHPAES